MNLPPLTPTELATLYNLGLRFVKPGEELAYTAHFTYNFLARGELAASIQRATNP